MKRLLLRLYILIVLLLTILFVQDGRIEKVRASRSYNDAYSAWMICDSTFQAAWEDFRTDMWICDNWLPLDPNCRSDAQETFQSAIGNYQQCLMPYPDIITENNYCANAQVRSSQCNSWYGGHIETIEAYSECLYASGIDNCQ